MTLALQVAFGTIIFWFVLILLRWLNVQPIAADTSRRLACAAAGLSGAFIGGAYTILIHLVSRANRDSS